MERIICKIRKGGERLERALREELLEADAPFGCNSQLPINIFQNILADFDIQVLDSDRTQLRKLGYITNDIETDSDYVDYMEILRAASPSQGSTTQSGLLFKTVVRIQAAWRAAKARLDAKNRKAIRNDSDLAGVNQAINVLGQRDQIKGMLDAKTGSIKRNEKASDKPGQRGGRGADAKKRGNGRGERDTHEPSLE